jgi:hypothetical protein
VKDNEFKASSQQEYNKIDSRLSKQLSTFSSLFIFFKIRGGTKTKKVSLRGIFSFFLVLILQKKQKKTAKNSIKNKKQNPRNPGYQFSSYKDLSYQGEGRVGRATNGFRFSIFDFRFSVFGFR